MAPRFLAVIATVRFTRLPQAATSSSLLRRTNSAQKVHEQLGGQGTWSSMPELVEVDEEGGPSYPILTGDHAAAVATWGRVPIVPGTPLSPPTPVFAKLEPSVIDDELARLADEAG